MLRAQAESSNNSSCVRVWDAPVRSMHWMIAVLILAAWLTREAHLVDLHAAAGYAVLALCLVRIAWGFAGTRYARFSDFVAGPAAVRSYVRALASREPAHAPGHNPAGGWWILVLLAFELAVTIVGIVALGGMHDMGPLGGRVAPAAAEDARFLHALFAWLMLGAIGVHVAGAIASSVLHRENLVAAMVSGVKRNAPANAASVAPHRALAVLIVAATASLGGAYLWHADAQARAAPPGGTGTPASWSAECDSCHLAYAPCLLPARSWSAILAPGADHFGEDLALTPASRERLEAIAGAPARRETWACWKMRASIPATQAPVRITDTPFWREAHWRMDSRDFNPPRAAGRHDCGACHRDASSTTFSPRSLRNLHEDFK
jgi:cytochrome b